MNRQCYQCHTPTDDSQLSTRAGVLLCEKCAASPSLAVQAYNLLVNSYDPAVIARVRDIVARLESQVKELTHG